MIKIMRWPLILLLLVISPLFFFGGPDYYSPRSLQELWNFGHFIYFGIFIVLLDSYWCAKHRPVVFRVAAGLSVLLFTGLTIELIQLGLDDRYFSWTDLLRDLSGGGVFLLWRLSTSVSSTQSILYKAASIFILVVNLIPLGIITFDEYRSHNDFPLLADFENKSELSRWDGKAELSQSTFVSQQGNYSGKIRLTLDQYSGVFLNHFPRDWSGRNGLSFSIYNQGPQIVLHYRVHDILHKGDMQLYTNRFNGKTVLTTGWNEVVIPMTNILTGPQGRKMDLTQISGFGVFVVREKERRIMYIDNVHLF